MNEMLQLYRPVGGPELTLILQADCRGYPPRLPRQPIFYPVLERAYAEEIAARWNPVDANSGYVGYVTEFVVDVAYAAQYEPQTVGAAGHRELWVPAERLAEFNAHIVPPIRISAAFYGALYVTAADCLDLLLRLAAFRRELAPEFETEVLANWRGISAHYLYWQSQELAPELSETAKGALLTDLKDVLVRNDRWFFTFGI